MGDDQGWDGSGGGHLAGRGRGEEGGVDSFKGPLTGTYVNESSFLMTDRNLVFIALKKIFLHRLRRNGEQ